MAFIPLRRQWTRKPLAPRLGNWRKLFSHKPIALFMHGTIGSEVYNLVDGQKVSVAGYTKKVGPNGVVVDTNNSNGGSLPITLSTPICSAFQFVKYNSAAQDHAIINFDNSAQRLMFWADTDGGNLRAASFAGFPVYGTASSLNPTAAGYKGTGYHCWGGTLDQPARTTSLFVNGVKENTGDPGTVDVAPYTTCNILTNNDDTKKADADVVWTIVFDKIIPDREAEYITKHPEAIYQILDFPTQYIDTTVAASSVPSLIPLRRSWTRKPNQPLSVDASHPIGKDIIDGTFYSDGGRVEGIHNIVRGRAPTLIQNGSPTIVLDKGKRVVSTLDATGDIVQVGTQPYIAAGGGFTWIVRMRHNYSTGSRTLFGNRYEGTASPLQFVKFINNGTFQFYNAGATNLTLETGGDVYKTYIVTKIGNNLTAYVDGVVTDTASTSNDMDANPVYIGGGGATGLEDVDAYYEFSMILKRGLTPSEVISFTGNPYQVLQPRTIHIPVGVAAGATHYTVNVDSQSYAGSYTDITLQYDRNLVVDSRSYAGTYTDITLQYDRNLTVDNQSYTGTYTDITLQYDRNLVVDSQSYSGNYTDVTLLYGYQLSVDSQSYAGTYTDITLQYDRNLTVDSQTYSGSYTDITPQYHRNLGVDSQSYAGTYTAVTLQHGYNLAVDSQSYVGNYTDAILRAARNILVDIQSYSGSYTDVDLLYGYLITVDSQSYSGSYTDITLDYIRSLAVTPQVYTGSYTDVTLSTTIDFTQWREGAAADTNWAEGNSSSDTWTEASPKTDDWT